MRSHAGDPTRHTKSGSAPVTGDVFLDEFGFTGQEAADMRCSARKAVNAQKSILSRQILECISRATTVRIAQAIRAGWFRGFSKTGQGMIIGLHRDGLVDIDSLEWLLTDFLVDPLVYRNVAAWCLHHALQEGSAAFQLDSCPSPTSEERLSGILLAKFSDRCDAWTKVASAPLKRTEASITLRCIDLSILGGEQATGGDIGLVLDFEEKWTQPASREEPPNSRIIPLILQAKRYVRPTADVSQRHDMRGYQHDLLTRNKCASAYVFYENGTKKIDSPLPPLIEPAERVAKPGRTNIFEDSLDLPSYFFKAMYDVSFGPTAASPKEALRMMYANADADQLAILAVIADSATAHLRYAEALRDLAPEIRRSRTPKGIEGPER